MMTMSLEDINVLHVMVDDKMTELRYLQHAKDFAPNPIKKEQKRICCPNKSRSHEYQQKLYPVKFLELIKNFR
jgi:hypothetical protein